VSDTNPPGSVPGRPDPQQPTLPLQTAHGGQAEYLEAGGGSPLPPEPPAPATGGGGRKRGLLIGAGVATLALVGVGAWAAAQFFSTGAQPTEALPASTLGYASIDLDPSGAQKIEALRTLNKFPAFKDELGLDTDDDIRQKLFEELDLASECDLDYGQDIEPWLGERMAVAAVDTGAEDPEVVVVLQVGDADAADAGLTKLRDCNATDGAETTGGWVIDGDWAVVAEDEQGAQAVVDATRKGTLAEDDRYQELTAAAGSAGIVTMYAAPEAGQYLSDSLGGVSGLAGEIEDGLTGTDMLGDGTSFDQDGANPMTETLKNFKGLAITVRFDDGALEVETAGDTGINLPAFYGSDRGSDVLETLPADTAAAIGVGFEPGWLTQVVEQMAAYTGGEMTAADLFEEASTATGLDLPQDAETLFGRSAALGFGSDFDPEAFFNSADGTDIPIALKVQGDADAIQAVVDKIVAQDESAADFLGTDSDGDIVVIGPDAEYRAAVLKHGTLGDNDVYQDVVRESDKASAVLFVNFNAGDDWLVRVAGDDPTVKENLVPLAGFGITAWKDDTWTHSVLRLTTD